MAEAMTQVNVRMSTALKQAGDCAFSAAGLSPSEVIRSVYVRASELSHALRDISDLVTSDGVADDAREEQRRRIEAFERSGHAFEDIAARYGLQPDIRGVAPMTDVEVEEAFYQDYLTGATP